MISLLNDYCFSVLGHAVACILQLAVCVLLDFFFFFLNLGFNKTKQAELVPKEIWVLHPA